MYIRGSRVTGVDRDAQTIELAAGGALGYDYCAVCPGAQTAYHGVLGLEAHSIPPKRVADAETIRTHFFDNCDEGGTAVIGGARLSGVQVAGELAAFRDKEGAHASVVPVEQLDTAMPLFDASFRQAIHDKLLDRGVEIRTGTTVESVVDATIKADTGDIDYGLLVWTGSIAGDDAMDDERPAVRVDLRLDRRAFVAGDATRAVGADSEPVPASASAALREAKTVAGNIVAQVEFGTDGNEGEFTPWPDPYRFETPGWIVSIGDGAVTQVGPSIFRGKAAKAMKANVGVDRLISVGAISRAVDLVDEELHA